MHKVRLALPIFLLGLSAAACGGSSSSGPAQGLTYEDPTGTGWRLVKNPASTRTRLVLDLVGPAGLKTRGAGFNLVAPSSVHFLRFDSTGFPVETTGVYELLNTAPFDAPDPLEPKLLAGAVKAGNLLTVGVFQKDRRATPKESGVPLLRIALELAPGARVRAGEVLPLELRKARHQAEDIGAFSEFPTIEMQQKAHLVDMPIALGTLHAN
jgi:hypothetical protein